MSAHYHNNRRMAKEKFVSTKRNYEAYDGKRSLLQLYETMGIENDYVRDLRRRVRRKQVQLLNRGSDGVAPKFDANR